MERCCLYYFRKTSNVSKLSVKKETTNPDYMENKDKILLNGMHWSAADDIEYNTIGASWDSD